MPIEPRYSPGFKMSSPKTALAGDVFYCLETIEVEKPSYEPSVPAPKELWMPARQSAEGPAAPRINTEPSRSAYRRSLRWPCCW